MLTAVGKRILMIDADGATEINDLINLQEKVNFINNLRKRFYNKINLSLTELKKMD